MIPQPFVAFAFAEAFASSTARSACADSARRAFIPVSLRCRLLGLLALSYVGCTLPAASIFGAERGAPSAGAAPAVAIAPSALPATDPAPEPAPAPEAAEPTPEELLDAWSLAAREDGAACRDALKADGYVFQAYPDKPQPDTSGCGIPHGVVVVKGPTGIRYEPPITVDCTLARSLAGFEKIVQEEAETHLRARVVRIGNLGGFACRPRNSRKGSSLSAHAFGSAVDISAFHPAKGTPAIIARDYADAARSTPAQDERRRFLRAVYLRLRAHEADLTYTVGPDFNRAHHDHFHLDRGGWHFWFNR